MDLVNVKVHAPTATVVMERQADDNRLDERLIEQLCQALDDLHQEKKVRAVVLTGAGANFCAGLDLHELYAHAQVDELEAMPLWIQTWQRFAELIEKMLRFPKPIVAAVDGQAMGAGFSLALASDLVVASDAAQFRVSAAYNGLVPGILTPLAVHRLGSSVASQLLFTSERLPASDANSIGWVMKVVPSTQVWVAANEIAAQCAVAPQQTQSAIKRLLNETIAEQLYSHLSVGAATAATVCSTEAGVEGIRAAVDQRSPNWHR